MTKEPPFSGTTRRYTRYALILAFITHAYLYVGMVLVEYVWHGRTWIFGVRPIVTLCSMMVLFALFCRSQWLKLDARHGLGRRWQLRASEVKLPEEI